LYYTASGIIRPHQTYRSDDTREFRAHVLIVRREILYYTVSGIITPIGLMIPETV